MKKYIFLLLIFTTQLFCQTKYEFIDSDRLGQRELKIQLPRNYNENLEQFYPLIVTLDGDYLFEVVSGNVDYMSYWDDMPDAIVVGINQESSKEDDLYISDEDYFPIRGGAKFAGSQSLPKKSLEKLGIERGRKSAAWLPAADVCDNTRP